MKRIIVKNINYEELENSMPTPNKYGKGFGGMRIMDTDTTRYLFDCFTDGHPLEVYTACNDNCMIKYKGNTTLTYYVNENSMKEYEATIETYIEFIIYLKKKFPSANIKVIGLTLEEKKLLILEKLKS